MVVRHLAVALWHGPLATDPAHGVVDRLDGPTRAKLLAAFAALVLLGLALLAFVWLSGRAVKRYMNYGNRESRPTVDRDDWALKPLIEKERRDRQADRDT